MWCLRDRFHEFSGAADAAAPRAVWF